MSATKLEYDARAGSKRAYRKGARVLRNGAGLPVEAGNDMLHAAPAYCEGGEYPGARVDLKPPYATGIL